MTNDEMLVALGLNKTTKALTLENTLQIMRNNGGKTDIHLPNGSLHLKDQYKNLFTQLYHLGYNVIGFCVSASTGYAWEVSVNTTNEPNVFTDPSNVFN